VSTPGSRDAFGATIFWVLVVCGGVTGAHMGVVRGVRRRGWAVPGMLVFPRIELIVMTAAVPGVTRAAVLLCATGEPYAVLLGGAARRAHSSTPHCSPQTHRTRFCH